MAAQLNKSWLCRFFLQELASVKNQITQDIDRYKIIFSGTCFA